MFGYERCTRCRKTRTQPITLGFLDIDGVRQIVHIGVCDRCRGLARFENDAARRRGAYSRDAVLAVPPWRPR